MPPASTTIQFTRDSVHPGDDADAPHACTLRLARRAADLAGFVRELGDVVRPRLASISGGRATWVLLAPGPLALVAQQWPEARPLALPLALSRAIADEVLSASTLTVRAAYLVQIDPTAAGEVIDRLVYAGVIPWRARGPVA